MNAQNIAKSTSGTETFADVVRVADSAGPTVVLTGDSGRACVAVSARLQGRVLTSSVDGPDGPSLGWVNLELISSGKLQEHFNAYGGEDRIWIAPEGGQFSVFFAPDAPFDLDHWYTPAPIDTEPYEQDKKTESSVSFRKRFVIKNHSGTKFQVQLERTVKLISEAQVWGDLKIPATSNVRMVAFESLNRLTNTGTETWSQRTGLLSLWVLGQFPASPSTTILIPIHEGSIPELGVPVTSDYFGLIPPERLAVHTNAIFLKADAEYRGKLGVNPRRAKGVLGSYDAERHLLTIVQEMPAPDPAADYVNNAWKIQDQPFKGDAINAYNDGPQVSGARLGHFYELETLSPAVSLAPGQSIEHTQRTIHIEGDLEQLDSIARAVLGVSLQQIPTAFQSGKE
jgi:hypothetical protein